MHLKTVSGATGDHIWPTGITFERHPATDDRQEHIRRDDELKNVDFCYVWATLMGPKSFLIKRRDDDNNFWRADVAFIKVASSSNGLIKNARVPIQERKVEYLRGGLLKNAKVLKRPHTREYFFLLLAAAPQKSSKSRWEGVQKIEDSIFSQNENMPKTMCFTSEKWKATKVGNWPSSFYWGNLDAFKKNSNTYHAKSPDRGAGTTTLIYIR